MFDLSRNELAEAWLSVPKTREPSETNEVDHSRFSVSTVNSDLFAELLAWSKIVDAQPSTSPSQSPPPNVHPILPTSECEIDAATIREAEPSNIPVPLSLIVDPTTLEIGFHSSCLEGLDEELLYSPSDAYAALCWSGCIADTVSLPPTLKDPIVFAKPVHTRSKSAAFDGRRRWQTRLPLTYHHASSDESDSDSEDECRTFREDGFIAHVRFQNPDSPEVHEVESFSSYDNEKAGSLIQLQHHFVPDMKDNVGSFPVPSTRRKGVHHRIASLLTFVRSS